MKMSEPCICDCMKSEGETVALTVSGKTVGIKNLLSITAEVRAANLSDSAAADELLARVKKCNYVPPAVETDYHNALLDYYRKTCPEKKGIFGKVRSVFSSGDCCCNVRIVEKKE